MVVCRDNDPVETRTRAGGTVECWLSGPEELIPPGGREPLVKEEISLADEA
jgi:peptide/nickel transport system ATP-binding protein